MADATKLHEALRLGHGPIWDPATYLLHDKLDQVALQDLAAAHLENQKTLAQAQLTLIEKTQAVLTRSAKSAKA
jgi:hypothetical protein